MSDWNLYPWNVAPLLTAWVLLVFAIYLSTIRRKSSVTRTFITLLFVVASTFALDSLRVIANNSGWDIWFLKPGLVRPLISLLGYASGGLFTLLCYRIGPVRFPKEQRIVIGLLVVVGILYGLDRVFWHRVAEPPYMKSGNFLMGLWTVSVLIRKWLKSDAGPDGARSMYGSLLGLGLFLFAVGQLAFVLDRFGDVQTAEILGEIAAAAAPILIGLVFLQFVPEATSLEAKFVAGGFLAVIVMAQLGTAPVNANHEIRYRYAPNLEPETIELIPTEEGGYRAEGRPYVFHAPAGDTLGTADDFTTALKPRFPVVVYGEERDSVWVTANGKAHFEPRQDGRTGRQALFALDVPTVAAFDMDLNPEEHGAVLGLSAEDSLMITWHDVPEFHDPNGNSGPFPVERRLMNAQLILRRDGTMSITRGETPFRPPTWARGISPGLSVMTAAGHAPDLTVWYGRRGTLAGSLLPVSASAVEPLYLEEHNFKDYQAWSRAESYRLLRNAFIVFFLVLLVIPAYYRTSVRKRLSRLMSGLADVNVGKLDRDIPVTINDEVGQLSSEFNEMTASLRQYAHRMEDLVEERTAELKATQAQLVEQEKLASLGSLTAGIAHEIKNPLNFVNNFAEVGTELVDELSEAIAAGKSEEAQSILSEIRENATQIAKHGKRADSIVRSMMQHARGGTSQPELIDLNQFLEEYINLSWHGARARDHGFQADVVRHFDASVGEVKVQPQEMGRVILNLLNNAFDALKGTDPAQVTVTTRRTNGRVEILVDDNGPGIPAEIRTKIFEPFFTTKATGEGTGLGLSLSYDIVTKGHGGEMSLGESEAGGASFRIRIPA